MDLTMEDIHSSSSEEDNYYNSAFNNGEFEANLLMKFRPRVRKNAVKNYVEVIVPKYTEHEFKTHFRVSRGLFENLKARFELKYDYRDFGYEKRLSPSKYILLFLWFAGHETCSFRDVADRFDVSVSSVHRIIKRVSLFLSDMSEEVIVRPNDAGKIKSARCFENKKNFPRIIGAIDGTHIVIDPPARGKDDYIDRKGRTSICLQAICNEEKKFIDIFVGYPGSVHDSRVFENSFIYSRLENAVKDYFILGDSAYPLRNNLLTPFKDNGHLTAAQKNFNKQLSSCRVIVEHSFGMLKQRFRQLYYCKLKGLPNICHFIRACCVLHNITSEGDFDFPQEDVENEEDNTTTDNWCPEVATTSAKTVRENICQELWRQRDSQ